MFGDAQELVWTENVGCPVGEDVTAIGIRAGGDTDEEVEEGLEHVALFAACDVACILFETTLDVLL